MVCVFCAGETQVTNSRHQKRNNNVWRRRHCLVCDSIFTTIEAPDYSSVFRINVNGDFKPFLTDLLYTEVLLALSDRKQAYMDAREVTNTIIKSLVALPASPLFIPSDISKVTAAVLQRFDRRAWHRYAAEHPSVAD
jgi:transcriptional repressor NrdR